MGLAVRPRSARRYEAVPLGQIAVLGLVAFAGDPVVIAPVRGNVEGGTREQLQLAVRRGISKRGDVPVVPADAPQTCVSPQCERSLIASNDAAFAITIDANQDETSLAVRLEVRDATGKVLGSASETCELCGLEEVVDMVVRKTTEVMEGLHVLSAPVVRIESVPEGASVLVDGKLIGLAPLEIEVEPGTREIELRREGHVTQRRTVEAAAGEREVVRVELSYERGKLKPHHPWLIGGSAALVAGAGFLGGAAGLFIVNGRPYERDCQPDADGDCRSIYRTRGAGFLAATLGVGAIGAGVALIVVGIKNKRDEEARYAVTPGGLRVRF